MTYSQFCPYSETCKVYENWVMQTGDKRLDIIEENSGGNYSYLGCAYSCLAKDALKDVQADGGVGVNEEIKKRLKNLSSKCSHITLLNLLDHLNHG